MSSRVTTRLVGWLFLLYKQVISPPLHVLSPGCGGCCYQPTCSEYAALALAEHGWMHGGALAGWRLLRCNPLARGGWDPVPPRKLTEKPSRRKTVAGYHRAR